MDGRLQEDGIHESTAKLFAQGSGQSDALRPLGVRFPLPAPLLPWFKS